MDRNIGVIIVDRCVSSALYECSSSGSNWLSAPELVKNVEAIVGNFKLDEACLKGFSLEQAVRFALDKQFRNGKLIIQMNGRNRLYSMTPGTVEYMRELYADIVLSKI